MAKIVYHDLKGTQVKAYNKPVKLRKIIDDMGLHGVNLCVAINHQYPETIDLDQKIYKRDSVLMVPEYLGGRRGRKILGSTLLAAATIATGGLGAAGGAAFLANASALAKAAVLIGTSVVVSGLTRLKPTSLSTDQETEKSPTYSISSSGNLARPYTPIPVVLGNMRYFPDLSSQPYQEPVGNDFLNVEGVADWTNVGLTSPFVEDQNNFTQSGSITVGGDTFVYTYQYGGTLSNLTTWLRYQPPFSYNSSFENASSTPTPSNGDRVKKTIVYIPNQVPNPISVRGKYVEWEDLYINGIGASFITPSFAGGPIDNIQTYLYTDDLGFAARYIKRSIKQIFNFGFGDLNITDPRIKDTPATDYREFFQYFNTKTPTDWPLAQTEANLLPTGGPAFNPEDTTVNGNVDVVDGAELGLDYPVTGPGPWVERESPENTFACHIDVLGNIFRQDPSAESGIGFLKRVFTFEYSTNNGATWNPMPLNLWDVNPASFYTIKDASYTYDYQNTFWVTNLTPGKYKVRARRESYLEEGAGEQSRLSCTQIRFYQSDINQNYVGQNRVGVIIEGSSQLNGSIDRISYDVAAKCWVYDGVGNPGDAGSYSWGTSQNPADWFLYWARGGFKNTSSNGSGTWPDSPTIGWNNSASNPNNTDRLFGCGHKEDEIDFDSIAAWWVFCDTQSLLFSGVVDTRQSQREILERIAAVGRGDVTYAKGKLGIVWEESNQPSIAIFTPSNIIKDSFQISYNTENAADEIVCTYFDTDSGDYSQKQVRATVPGVTNPVEIVNIDLIYMAGGQSQAQREANILAAKQAYLRRVISFDVSDEGLCVTKGDVIILSHDMTNYDFSGRIVDMELTTDQLRVYKIKIDCPVPDTVTDITVRKPNNTFLNFTVTHDDDWMIINEPWNVADAPGHIGCDEVVGSAFDDSVEQDFLVLAGFSATPGKRCRIVDISPTGLDKYTITCTDEEEVVYANEYSLQTSPTFTDYTKISAKAFNVQAWLRDDGKYDVHWQLSGASLATVSISIDGNPATPYVYNGSITQFSNYVCVDVLGGVDVELTVTPVVTGSPYTIEAGVVNFST